MVFSIIMIVIMKTIFNWLSRIYNIHPNIPTLRFLMSRMFVDLHFTITNLLNWYAFKVHHIFSPSYNYINKNLEQQAQAILSLGLLILSHSVIESQAFGRYQRLVMFLSMGAGGDKPQNVSPNKDSVFV